ncbi:hypothetical protein [Gordonia sp. SID5947]
MELASAGGTERFLAVAAMPLDVDETILVIGVRPGRVLDVERWLPMPT